MYFIPFIIYLLGGLVFMFIMHLMLKRYPQADIHIEWSPVFIVLLLVMWLPALVYVMVMQPGKG